MSRRTYRGKPRRRDEGSSQEISTPRLHPPAMVVECLHYLRCAERNGGIYVDGTLGTGGHAEAVLECDPEGRLIGIDLDSDSIEVARQRLARYESRITFVQGNFRNVHRILEKLGIHRVDGLLFDTGVSLWQLDSPERGFSFRFDAPLNMAFDRSSDCTGLDLVNRLAERELASLIREYSDERWAERIARSIVDARSRQLIRTTAELADIITEAIPIRFRPRDIDPATRTFAAIRQATNDEPGSLEEGIFNAATVMAPNASLVVLTYSSNDDRIAKQQLKRLALRKPRPQRYPRQESSAHPPSPIRDSTGAHMRPDSIDAAIDDSISDLPRLQILTPKPVRPSLEEVRNNPRCRGARLRAAVRLA